MTEPTTPHIDDAGHNLPHLLHGRHPSVAGVARFFEFAHLPPHLQEYSAPVAGLAATMLERIGQDSPELTTGLLKLLEAKDCFVRAGLDQPRAAAPTPSE